MAVAIVSVGIFISGKPLTRDVRSFNHGVGDGEHAGNRAFVRRASEPAIGRRMALQIQRDGTLNARRPVPLAEPRAVVGYLGPPRRRCVALASRCLLAVFWRAPAQLGA